MSVKSFIKTFTLFELLRRHARDAGARCGVARSR